MSEASYALAVSATVPQLSPGDRAEHPDLRALLDCWRRMRGLATRQTDNGVCQAESIWLPFGDCEVRQIMGMTVFTAT